MLYFMMKFGTEHKWQIGQKIPVSNEIAENLIEIQVSDAELSYVSRLLHDGDGPYTGDTRFIEDDARVVWRLMMDEQEKPKKQYIITVYDPQDPHLQIWVWNDGEKALWEQLNKHATMSSGTSLSALKR